MTVKFHEQMDKIKRLTYWLIAWPAILVFLLLRGERKERLIEDLIRFSYRRTGHAPHNVVGSFYNMMVSRKEFRSVFYMRIGHLDKLIRFFLPGMSTMNFGSKSHQIAGGIFVEHGWAMVIDAETVGKNLWINQGVTIGWGRGGHPTIGDNVRIGSGAVVLGGIIIGDNVNIGANAIVVDDVPSNTTVCSPKARIVRSHYYPTMNASLVPQDGGGNS